MESAANILTCPLTQRGILRISGDDRRTFLQGLISNDINLCVGDQMLYAALLTPQGKFLHDMFIVDAGDSFLIDCEGEARAIDLLQRLRAYKLRAKVTLENVSDQFDAWVGWDEEQNSPSASFRRKPKSRHTISQNLPTVPLDPDFRRDDTNSYADPRLEALGWRAIMKKGERPEGQITDFTAYDKHRLKLGTPDGSRDMIIEKSTLLEGNFDRLNGISWTKGCYIGQELTARMHHRALVKKRLFQVAIEGPVPAAGSGIQLNGEEIGEIRSSCEDVGLALLGVEKANAASQENAGLISNAAKLKIYIAT